MQERELWYSPERPLIGWRLFRVRRSEVGLVLSAPLIHDPGYERFPNKVITATCYDGEHPAPETGCRCGLYAAIEGTLDSLSGYLNDSAHDLDPPVYAEVACTGRVFVDLRGVRAERIEVLGLAMSASASPSAEAHKRVVQELAARYGIELGGLDLVPAWVTSNAMEQGAPPGDATLDLDLLKL